MTKKSKKKTFVKSTAKGLKSIGQCANFIIGCENRFIWFILELFVRPLGILRVTSDCSYTKLTYSQKLVNLITRIPTVKLKIPGKAFLKSESRTSVTFKL